MMVEIEHVAKEHQRDHPDGQQHTQTTSTQGDHFTPAIGLQCQDPHGEDHQHPLIADRRHGHTGTGHPQPAMTIGKQEQHQRERHKQGFGVGRDKVDGKWREGHQPDAIAGRIQILPQLAQTEEKQRQYGQKREIGYQVKGIEGADPQQFAQPESKHRVAGQKGPVGRVACRQSVWIGVISHIGNTLEPATVKLTEQPGNIILHGRGHVDGIEKIGLHVVVHATEIAHGIEHDPADHKSQQYHAPIMAADGKPLGNNMNVFNTHPVKLSLLSKHPDPRQDIGQYGHGQGGDDDGQQTTEAKP